MTTQTKNAYAILIVVLSAIGFMVCLILLSCGGAKNTQTSTTPVPTKPVILPVKSGVTWDMRTNDFIKENTASPLHIYKDYSFFRLGTFSYAFDLYETDLTKDGTKKSLLVGLKDAKGNEIFEDNGNTSYYVFSYYLPAHFSAAYGHAGDPNHVTLWQLKSDFIPNILWAVWGDSIAIKVNTYKDSFPEGNVYNICPVIREQWQDFIIKIHFAQDGQITVYAVGYIKLADGTYGGQASALLKDIHDKTYLGQKMGFSCGLYVPANDSNYRHYWIGAVARTSSFEAAQNVYR